MASLPLLSMVLCFLSLSMTVSYAALPSELYWQSLLPDTPIPKAVQDLLSPAGKINKPASIGVQPTSIPQYARYASEEQLRQKDYSYFFLEKDLQPGTKLNLHFTKTTTETAFLPRKVAESIPFSSTKLPDILNRFSVKPGSREAEVIKQTIEDCESPAIQGEDRYCATSLESMVDYCAAKLGKNAKVVATKVNDDKITPKQQYTIEEGVKEMGGDKSMVCHNQNYAYAVFYCHLTLKTKAYLVPLVGADDTKVNAVAVCHSDTSKWNPRHLAFQVLKVKPGAGSVCHFLPEDHIVWVSN